MSSFSITNLRTELRLHLGVDSTDLQNTDADLLLNRSKWALEEELKLPQNKIHTTFATVGGTYAYAQAFPIDYILSLALTDPDAEKWVKLIPMSEDEYNDIYSTKTTDEGKPERYFVRGTELILYPTPDDVYTVQVTRKEILTDISDANTTLSMSQALQEILLLGAVFRGYVKFRDFNSSFRVRDIVGGLLRTYIDRDVKEQADWHYAQVTPILNKYNPE